MTSRSLAWKIGWMLVLYHEKENKGTETGLKEKIIDSIGSALSLNAGEIPRWGWPVSCQIWWSGTRGRGTSWKYRPKRSLPTGGNGNHGNR